MPRRSDWRVCAGCACGLKPRAADVRPEGGARCVSSARRDLCGGRGEILVPTATQALSQLLQLPRDKCDLSGQKPAARMSAAKSASGAMKSVRDIATLILATLTGAVGCRRIHRS